MPFDQPSGVVALAESEQRLAQILDGVESLHPQEIFLQGSDEAFGTAIALRRADEGGRALGTEEFEFPLESVGHVLGSMIMTHGEAASRLVGEAAEMLADALADRFERLEAGPARRGMDADASGGAMVDRDEYRREALAGDRRRQVGSPHRVQAGGAIGQGRPAAELLLRSWSLWLWSVSEAHRSRAH